MNMLPGNLRFGARQPVKRVEDERLLTGKGRFTDDLVVDGAAWLVVLRSPHAHARITNIDVAEARAMPGVQAVITGADLIAADVGSLPTLPIFKRRDGSPMAHPPREILASEIVRFAGEGVAAVVADTQQAAEAAAEAIVVDYEVLEAVIDVRAAREAGAHVVWPGAPDNVAAYAAYGDAAAAEAAFAQAAHIVSLDLINQRLVPCAIEPRAVCAVPDLETGRLTLHACSQTPTTTRDLLAGAVLKRPKESIRVLVGDIGGGFGHKTALFPEDALVAYAAVALQRPVRWRGDRGDEFIGGTHGRDLATCASLALDADGKILALRAHSLGNLGAAITGTGVLVHCVIGPFVATGTYHIPLLNLETEAVLTNTAPTGAYRGAGRPEAIYIIERLMDEAARTLNMDPRELRKRNVVTPEQMPYKNAMGQVYDSGLFAQTIDAVSIASDWDGFSERKRAAEARGMLYGRGLASYVEWTGGNQFTEQAHLTATSDGRFILHSATQGMGQGLETTFAQMVAGALNVPIDRVTVMQGDTDMITGYGSVGSRSLFVGGNAVATSAADFLDKARDLASEALEASQADLAYDAGKFVVVGTDRAVSIESLAAAQEGGVLKVESQSTVGGPTWPNGSHVAEVEIDPETGVVRIARYTTVDDVGTPMNPMLVDGQIHGGLAQGIGQALYENTVYDADGQLLTASFQDYCVPRADDLPFFDTALQNGSPCLTNALGAKGCGESGTVGGTPTIVNAVMDALAVHGVRDLQMPLTAHKIWGALQAAR